MNKGCFSGFSKLEKLYKKYFQDSVADFNFTPNEVAVLMFLYNNAPELDTASDIARYKGISKGLVASSVDALCRRGYLEARRDERDRRVVHLSLSPGCEDLRRRIEVTQKRFTLQVERGIPEENLRILEETMTLLSRNIEKLLKGENENESIKGE